MNTAKQAEPQAQAKHKTVAVLYNGATKSFGIRAAETVEQLLGEAIRGFGIVDNQHLLSLFNEAGAELPDASTLHKAGVKAGEKLVLRPGVVKGG